MGDRNHQRTKERLDTIAISVRIHLVFFARDEKEVRIKTNNTALSAETAKAEKFSESKRAVIPLPV